MTDQPAHTHVLSRQAVRWGIETLGAQKLHPTFAMYLYLRTCHLAGNLESASASSPELQSLIVMPGHPSKPFYSPLIDRGGREDGPLPSFWRARNIAGSWSPTSLERQEPSRWLVADREYTLPDNHAERALIQLLFGLRVSALAMGAYFLRNDGFVLTGDPAPVDVIWGFRDRFSYGETHQTEYQTLFFEDVPDDIPFDWFDPVEMPMSDSAAGEEQ